MEEGSTSGAHRRTPAGHTQPAHGVCRTAVDRTEMAHTASAQAHSAQERTARLVRGREMVPAHIVQALSSAQAPVGGLVDRQRLCVELMPAVDSRRSSVRTHGVACSEPGLRCNTLAAAVAGRGSDRLRTGSCIVGLELADCVRIGVCCQ